MIRVRGKEEKSKKIWEFFAKSDPLWAICTDPAKKGRKWNLSDFFLSGEKEMQTVFEYIESIGLFVNKRGYALDFGCGVGRLTQAFSKYFDFSIGIDISPTMIKLAKDFNKYPGKCQYLVNESDELTLFKDNCFVFIYTNLVLQHIKPKYINNYIRSFVRLLKPGGILIFQVQDHFKYKGGNIKQHIANLKSRIKFRRRLKHFFSYIGIIKKEHDMPMFCLTEKSICNLIKVTKANIVDIKLTNATTADFNGRLHYLENEPEEGYISKQYCVTKTLA